MPRSLWKGNISFGLVNIPVGLFPAEQSDDGVSFSQVDKRTMAPIGYKRYNKNTGDEVPWEEIVRAYEYEPGRYVVFTDEDFEQANVKASHTVEILDFVDEAEILPLYYNRPYFLAPMTSGATAKGYALLRETMRRTGKVGIARVVIRTREHLAAVIARGDVLVLEILRFAYELRSAEDLEVPNNDLAALGVSEKELKMAEMLVAQMVEKWSPEKYTDRYREDVMARIRKKIEAGDTQLIAATGEAEEEASTEVVDIMSLLKRSVERSAGAHGDGGAAEAEAEEAPAARSKGGRKSSSETSRPAARGRGRKTA